MPITLYHSRHSRSLRCVWALEEMGLDYDLVTLKFPPGCTTRTSRRSTRSAPCPA